MSELNLCKRCHKPISDKKHGNAKFCTKTCFNAFYRRYHENWNKSHPQIEQSYTKNGIRAYLNIKARTSNPKHPDFSNYGARGITLELTVEEFLKIYFQTDKCQNCGIVLNDADRNAKNGRTLDRISQAHGYKLGNLRILCRSCNSSLAYHRRTHGGSSD